MTSFNQYGVSFRAIFPSYNFVTNLDYNMENNMSKYEDLIQELAEEHIRLLERYKFLKKENEQLKSGRCKFETVKDEEDYQVDYNREFCTYRFSLFKDGHFVDEWFFDEVKKDNSDVKKRLLDMYEDALDDATSMWLSEYCCGEHEAASRRREDEENVKEFTELLEKL